MHKTTKEKLFLRRDRDGKIEEHIRIKIWQEKKDPDTKMYTIKSADFIVRNLGTDNESMEQNVDIYNNPIEKSYYTSYDDYENEKSILLELYPTDLTGGELDDYLLLKKLEINLDIDPVYGLSGEDWE